MAESDGIDEMDHETGLLLQHPTDSRLLRRKLVLRATVAAASFSALALLLLACVPRQGGAPATAFGRHPGRPLETLAEIPFSSYASQQQDAAFKAGQALRIYAVGSSNTIWVPWVEQLHLLLLRLGYTLPLVHARHNSVTRTFGAPTCEDSSDYAPLRTARIGEPGWGSWGFAYEGDEGCVEGGWRIIAGQRVSCRPAWGCPADSPGPLRLSQIAEDAAKSDITLLSCWINDSKQLATGNACFDHANVSRVDTAFISLETLRRMIRSIHARNPDVWVVVLANYPDVEVPPQSVRSDTLNVTVEINRRVKEGLSNEPRTLFADYVLPLGVNLFQHLHFGHPNCRAAKLMANGVVDTLFHAGLLANGLGGEEACPISEAACSTLSPACCQRTATCRLLRAQCVQYGPGG